MYLAGLALLALTGCTPHDIDTDPSPVINAAGGYTVEGGATAAPGPWYATLGDSKLNGLIEEALANNLTVAQALARLDQAEALTKNTHSGLFPKIDGEISSRKSRQDGDSQEGVSEIGGALDWEADLFGRIRSAVKADSYEARAAADDVDAVRLALSADVAENYYSAIGRQLRLTLLQQQIDTDGEILSLNTMRFEEGLGTKVEVLQQQSQLADAQTLIPPAQSDLRVFENGLDVLLGAAPDGQDRTAREDGLAPDDSLPPLGVPSDLLINRPDLRALRNDLVAADADIAEAIADRLPRITLTGSLIYADGAGFTGPVASVLGALMQPLLDWGERKAEVERNEALYKEKLAAFSQAYLEAIAEVENTLYQEDRQREYVARLESRRSLLSETVEQARSVYQGGLSDYLPVLNALQDLRGVERDLLDQRVTLTLLRIRLFRALGGQVPSTADIPSAIMTRI